MSTPSFMKVVFGMRRDPIRTLETIGYPEKRIIKLLSSPYQVLYTVDPKVVKTVFVERPKKYGMATFMIQKLKSVLGEGLSIAVGESWRKRRAFMQGFFVGENLGALLPAFGDSLNQTHFGLLGGINKVEIDVTEEMRKITLRNIFYVLFSDSFDENMTSTFAFASQQTGKRFWRWARPSWLPRSRSDVVYKNMISEIDRYIYSLLEERLRDQKIVLPSQMPKDITDHLVKAYLKQDPLWDKKALRDELVTLAFAGFDTTACLLTWCMLMLASSPKSAEGLIQEASQELSFSDSHIDVGTLFDHYPQTVAFVTEVLRLFPPIWLLTREAFEEDILDSLQIRKGAHIFVSPHMVHRHPEYWSSPELFDPGRHLNTSKKNLAYIPFGAGLRHCLGHQFAIAEAVVTLAHLASRFQFSFAPGETLPRQEPGVVNWPKGKPKLLVTQRNTIGKSALKRSKLGFSGRDLNAMPL